MNGIISFSASRSALSSKQWIGSIASGACLFAGFFMGTHASFKVAVPSIPSLNLFEKQSVDFDKITWVKDAFSEKQIQFKPAHNVETLSLNLEFVPFQLPTKERERTHLKRIANWAKKSEQGLKQLDHVAQELKALDPNIFDDYKVAIEHIRYQFQFATYRKLPANVIAAIKGDPGNRAYADVAPQAPKQAPTGPKNPKVVHAIGLLPQREKAKPQHIAQEKTVTQSRAPVTSVAVTHIKPSEPMAEVTDVTYPMDSVPVTNQMLDSQTIQESIKQTLSSSETTKAEVVAVNIGSTVQLTEKEKRNLTNALLDSQVAKSSGNTPQALAKNTAKAQARINQQTKTNEADAEQGSEPDAFVKNVSQCDVLASHEFQKPTYGNQGTVNTQITPERKEWISKTRNCVGWVKVESAEALPTLTIHPAPNHGATLLLDQNALALMALTTGVHIAKGAGVVAGLVPDGYKIEFSGRGEETHYFESNGSKYFAVLNAEPGASVVQLISEKDPSLNSTVFVPVLDDTVTYLDLATPRVENIAVQIRKNPIPQDQEVVGLTIGISTQGGIQSPQGIHGITQVDGKAVLKNVSYVPGFPLYVDVSSKFETEKSYTYRYELKRQNKNGVYELNQVAERSLYRWLRQEKHGLSDQSAMIVGFYDRKKLNGFKESYTVHTEAKTSKFGLEPRTYSILWDGKISSSEPLEGDAPRFMSVQVPEGLSQIQLLDEGRNIVRADLIPVSPRVIHVVSE